MTPAKPKTEPPTLDGATRRALRTAHRTLQADSPTPKQRLAAATTIGTLLARSQRRAAPKPGRPKPKRAEPRYELRITGLTAAGLEDAIDLIMQRQEPQLNWPVQLRRIDQASDGTEHTTAVEAIPERLDAAGAKLRRKGRTR